VYSFYKAIRVSKNQMADQITFAELQQQIELANLMSYTQWERGTGRVWSGKPPESERYEGDDTLPEPLIVDAEDESGFARFKGREVPLDAVLGYMATLSGESVVFGSDTGPVSGAAQAVTFLLGMSFSPR
jgi:hypothetical protein